MADPLRSDPVPFRKGEEASGDLFAAAFDASRVPMVVTDSRQPDDPIVACNDAFLALTGYARDEVMGRNCRFLQGEGTDPAAIARMREAIAAGLPAECEVLNYRKDGSAFWNAMVMSPVRRGETVTHFTAALFDISAKKQAELELSRGREALEQEVARRTRDLQAALDQKTALLHEVDHRVKNNLQVVSSLVLLKARRMRDESAQKVLNNVAERISALSTVYRLLYSVGDVGRFDVREFVTDLSSDLMSSADPRQIELTLRVEPIAVSSAKATPLALLIHELMANALRHAFPGGRKGRIGVVAERVNGAVQITVEDDGVGLDAAPRPPEAFGRTLIDMLARQLRAGLRFEDGQPGTRAVVEVPLNAEEAHP